MKCTKCNKEIDNNSKYCPYCGQKVNKEKQYIKGISNDNLLCLIDLIILLSIPISIYFSSNKDFTSVFFTFSSIIRITSLPLSIYIVIKYKKNVFARFLLIACILCIAIDFYFSIVSVNNCIDSSCDSSSSYCKAFE